MVRHNFSIAGKTNSKNARSEAARNRTRNPCALCQQDRKKCSGDVPCQRCLVDRKKPEECKPGTSRRKASFIVISGPSATDAPGTSVGSRPTSIDSQRILDSSGFHSLPKETGEGSAAHGTKNILPRSASSMNNHWLSSTLRPAGVGSGTPVTYDVSRVSYGGSSNNQIDIQGRGGDTYWVQQRNNEWLGFRAGALGQCSEYSNIAFNQRRDVTATDLQVTKIIESSVPQREVSLDTTHLNMFTLGQGTYNSLPPETIQPRAQPVVKHCNGKPWTLNKIPNDLSALFSTVGGFDSGQAGPNTTQARTYQNFGYMDSLADFPYYRQSGSNGGSV